MHALEIGLYNLIYRSGIGGLNKKGHCDFKDYLCFGHHSPDPIFDRPFTWWQR